MDNQDILISVIGGLVTILSSLALYFVKRQKDIVDEHTKAIASLQSTAVSDSHVRAVVKEELSPLNHSVNKLLESMHKIEVHIAEEKGFKEGAAMAARRKEDHR
jgi:hypothetical protein